jgi:threonine dehydrogenase-like Zn-dependent dehydrogenase
VVPFPIACGACAACAAELYSCCENSNPNAGIAEKMFGHPGGGIFGYSHLTGGFAGGRRSTQGFPSPTSGP